MREKRIKRTMTYFINATDELINEIGIKNVTIRNVAKRAGYNSATIYNYFENLDNLIFFGAMKNIKDYALSINLYLADTDNAMDRFLKIWECFCNYAYLKPDIYNALFFPKLSKNMEDYVSEFYSMYPEDLVTHNETVKSMLMNGNIHARGMTTIMDCISEGFIEQQSADKLNEMTLLLFEGMLTRVISGSTSYDDARHDTMDYIKVVVKSFLIKDYSFNY